MLGFRALGPGEFALEQSLAYPRFRALRVPVRGKKWVCLRDLKGIYKEFRATRYRFGSKRDL